jgi:hypothetical protein
MMEVLWQQRHRPITASLTRDEILAAAQRLPGLNAEPGTEMAYSNTGWRLAQRVLQKPGSASATRRPSPRLMAEFACRSVCPTTRPRSCRGSPPAIGVMATQLAARPLRLRISPPRAGWPAAPPGWRLGLGAAGRARLAGGHAGAVDRAAPLRGWQRQRLSARAGCSASEDVALVGHGGSLPGYRNHFLMAPSPWRRRRRADQSRGGCALAGAARPRRAAGPGLPAALRAHPPVCSPSEGPFWAELTPDAISFMGGYERLVSDGADGMRSLPAYLDIS